MTVVNYVTLRQGYPIGFGMDELAILAFLPLAALFNGTLALYTVPLGEFIANVVKSRNENAKLKCETNYTSMVSFSSLRKSYKPKDSAQHFWI